MSFLNRNYVVEQDDETGLAKIVVTGRCTGDEAAGIERGCTRRYRLVVLPHASGAILKSMDGTRPYVQRVTVPTTGVSYSAVKVFGRAQALAPAQVGGLYAGKTILRFAMHYQEVGGVA